MECNRCKLVLDSAALSFGNDLVSCKYCGNIILKGEDINLKEEVDNLLLEDRWCLLKILESWNYKTGLRGGVKEYLLKIGQHLLDTYTLNSTIISDEDKEFLEQLTLLLREWSIYLDDKNHFKSYLFSRAKGWLYNNSDHFLIYLSYLILTRGYRLKRGIKKRLVMKVKDIIKWVPLKELYFVEMILHDDEGIKEDFIRELRISLEANPDYSLTKMFYPLKELKHIELNIYMLEKTIELGNYDFLEEGIRDVKTTNRIIEEGLAEENPISLALAARLISSSEYYIRLGLDESLLESAYDSISKLGSKVEEFLKETLKINPNLLEDLNKKEIDNELVESETNKQDGKRIEDSSERLEEDKEIEVKSSAGLNQIEINYILDKTTKKIDNRERLLKEIRRDGFRLRDGSDRLRGDKEVVLEAIKQYPMALKFASKELKDDKEVVLEAVKGLGDCIYYASERLRGDKETVLKAMETTEIIILDYLGEGIKEDRDIILEAMRTGRFSLSFIDEKMRADKEIALEAVKRDGRELKYVDKSLQNDEEILEASVLTII